MIEFKNSQDIECVFDDAKTVRKRVFMEEQGFKNEFDDVDTAPQTIHLTAYIDNQLAGCARFFPSDLEPNTETAPNKWVFGRLAVLPEMRKGGIGSAILSECEHIAAKNGAREMHLHAQCNAAKFYENAGYESYGSIEFDEHVEHQWMSKEL